MNHSEKISIYRVIPCIAIFCSAMVSAGVLCYINQLQFDEMFCVGIVILGILPLLFFEMTYERRREGLFHNIQTTYGRIALGFFLCCVLMLIMSFLPEFFRPVMLFPLIMVAFSNENIGLMTGLFFNVLLALTTGESFHELLACSWFIPTLVTSISVSNFFISAFTSSVGNTSKNIFGIKAPPSSILLAPVQQFITQCF